MYTIFFFVARHAARQKQLAAHQENLAAPCSLAATNFKHWLPHATYLVLPFSLQQNQLYIFLGFLIFETCVGIFWPSMGTMRGKYVAEESEYSLLVKIWFVCWPVIQMAGTGSNSLVGWFLGHEINSFFCWRRI